MKKQQRYRSKFEKDFAAKHKDAKYETLKIKWVSNHIYTPDWVLPNGVILEQKGLFDSADRSKHLKVRAQNPGLDIRFVFQADRKISKASKTKYSDWAKKHGFQYCIGAVPPSWLI